MSKAEQVLTIEPQNELKFRGPFNVPVTSYMKLSNPSDRKVLFKIKTTAPKKYCVRPNSGLLDPESHIEIAICLQPFIFDPSEKNKHKFMVQTVFAPEGEGNVDQLWKDVSIDQMMDSKLKCVFELPAELNVSGQEEAVKVSPKAPLQAASSSATTNDTELEKAAVEVQQLREEESSLRQENLRLKEEVLKLKRSATVHQPQLSKYTPTVTQEQSISLLHLALGITLAIFGIILGKFIL